MGLLSRKKPTTSQTTSASSGQSDYTVPSSGAAGHKKTHSNSAGGYTGGYDKYGQPTGYNYNQSGTGLPSPPGSPIEANYQQQQQQQQQQQSSRPQSSSSRNGASRSSGDRNSSKYVENKMSDLNISGGSRKQNSRRDSVESVEMEDADDRGNGRREERNSRDGGKRAQSAPRSDRERADPSANLSPSKPAVAQRGPGGRPLSSSTLQSALSPSLSMASSQRKTSSRYTLTDFTFLRTLGTGSFGRVHLVRSQHNSRAYAIKVLSKERVVKMKQVEHTNSEREMLDRVRHPFLVNLWGTFKDSRNLYMVMDFVAGGELFSLLRKSQRFPDPVAKFFAAEVALALDYLHSLEIIYRDLKPENILLGADGHVKITDFGFAKHVPDITWTLCGTPDYLAPEIVQSRGYNKSVDWYALGVLMFEMLAGYPPFFTEDANPMRLYEKIIAGKIRYPSYFAPEAKDLLKSLLTSDLTKRFGNLANGSRDIFGHAWFQEVDWERLYRKEIPAPYVPKVEGDWDASNFDSYPEVDLSEYGIMGADPHGHLFQDF